MTRIVAVTLLLCCGLNSSLSAQTTASIRLSVKDLWGGTKAKAQVILTEAVTGKQFSQETGDQGDCTISNLAPGKYNVSANVPGFAVDSPASLEVAEGQTKVVEVTLSPTDIDLLSIAALTEPLRANVIQMYTVAKVVDDFYNKNFAFTPRSPDEPKKTMVTFILGASTASGVTPQYFLVILDAKWVQQSFVWCQDPEEKPDLLFGLSRQIIREGLASAQMITGGITMAGGFETVTPKNRPETLGMPKCLFGDSPAKK